MGEGERHQALREESEPLAELMSRLLFLEGAIAGRRALCVGPLPAECVATLHALGASEVHVVDPARGESYHVGDGTIDLVVDFALPEALARGEHFRLHELARVLSPQGFGWSALSTWQVPGLAALASPRHAAPAPRAFVSSAALAPGLEEETPSALLPERYRAWVLALQAAFPCVEVYFQSLMLGYFLGPFDLEEGREGVAPHTGLMQGGAEPASHYLFAFGHAVPVIRDVSLVQVPLAPLLAEAPSAAAPLALAPPHRAPPAAAPPVVGGDAAKDDPEVGALRQALAEQGAALAKLARGVQDLMAERAAREGQLGELRATLETQCSALTEAGHQVRAALAQRDALQRALQAREGEAAALREELAALRSDLVRSEQQREAQERSQAGHAALDAERCARLLGEAVLEEARAAYRRVESERDWFKSALEELQQARAPRP